MWIRVTSVPFYLCAWRLDGVLIGIGLLRWLIGPTLRIEGDTYIFWIHLYTEKVHFYNTCIRTSPVIYWYVNFICCAHTLCKTFYIYTHENSWDWMGKLRHTVIIPNGAAVKLAECHLLRATWLCLLRIRTVILREERERWRCTSTSSAGKSVRLFIYLYSDEDTRKIGTDRYSVRSYWLREFV